MKVNLNTTFYSGKWTLVIVVLSTIMIISNFSMIMKAPDATVTTSVKLIILDPGHGHATFMQGSMNPAIDPEVHVYAPPGPDVQQYINSIERINSRKINPTKWKSNIVPAVGASV